MDGRRFSDTVPALDPITNSDWDMLNGEQKSDLLRDRHAQVISVLRLNVDATHQVAEQVEKAVVPLLEANTAATARTEGKVDAAQKSIDLLVTRTEKPLAIWNDWEGTRGLLSRAAGLCKDVAGIAVAVAAGLAGYHTLMAWAPWK